MAETRACGPPPAHELAAAKNLSSCAGRERRPLLLWFEDMQWTDAETRTLIEAIAKEVENSPLLIIMTYRPEYKQDWPGDNYRTIAIEALDRPNAELLVRTLIGGDERAAMQPAGAANRGDAAVHRGNGAERRSRAACCGRATAAIELTRELRAIQIPESVQSVIASTHRSSRGVETQGAAADGFGDRHRTFRLTLLAQIADMPPESNCKNCWRICRPRISCMKVPNAASDAMEIQARAGP